MIHFDATSVRYWTDPNSSVLQEVILSLMSLTASEQQSVVQILLQLLFTARKFAFDKKGERDSRDTSPKMSHSLRG
ncbi:MAG: hypothetical protein AAFV25_12295, partial [Bacteroidota bacterium]